MAEYEVNPYEEYLIKGLKERVEFMHEVAADAVGLSGEEKAEQMLKYSDWLEALIVNLEKW